MLAYRHSKALAIRAYGATPAHRQAMKTAARWMAAKLLTPRLANKCHITLALLKNLKKREGFFGECVWTDRNVKPRKFVVRIDSTQSFRQQLLTLAHELTHVKQFATGELVDYMNAPKSRWRNAVIDTKNLSYDREPWEIEARRTERRLYQQWRNAHPGVPVRTSHGQQPPHRSS